MIDHSHNVQICAGCICGDLWLALSLLQRHNATLEGSSATRRVEEILKETVEVIQDASKLIEAITNDY